MTAIVIFNFNKCNSGVNRLIAAAVALKLLQQNGGGAAATIANGGTAQLAGF